MAPSFSLAFTGISKRKTPQCLYPTEERAVYWPRKLIALRAARQAPRPRSLVFRVRGPGQLVNKAYSRHDKLMPLSAFIRENIEQLLGEWESFAQELLPPGKTLHQAGLRDDAEALLRAIALDMETAQSREQQTSKSKGGRGLAGRSLEVSSHAHAHHRYAIGFSVNQLVAEYRAMRASVIALWTRDMKQFDRPALEELTRFNEAIDEVLANSVTLYTGIVERAKNLFLAVLGHDLRSPLSAVLSAANMLLRSEESTDRTVKTAALILRSSTRMRQMVSDLIDFTRTRLGDCVPIVSAPMDLGVAVREVIEEIALTYPRHKLRSVTNGNLRGSWDEARMKQVLTNLIENAVQHGSINTPITVTATGDNERVALTVHNAGPPIPAYDQTRIFEPLVGTKDTSSPIISTNMGLGLYIVRQIVQAHGGTIDMESSKSAGTTFTAQLPRF
jgi:signal transduction histidine kinase